LENCFIFKLHITPIWVKQLQYKACKHKKKPTNIIYVNVGEIFDRGGPYRLKSSDCFMKVQTTDKRSEAGLLITKFRTSDHCLQIETGRYNNIPRQQRLCITCNILEDLFK
jgi:hypothetical protein